MVRRANCAPRHEPCFETRTMGPLLSMREVGSFIEAGSIKEAGNPVPFKKAPRLAAPTPLILRKPRSGCPEGPPMVRRSRHAHGHATITLLANWKPMLAFAK
jgi:hypothetical protein